LLGHEVTVISGADGVVGEDILEGVRFINIDRSGIVHATRSLPGLSLARQAVFLPVLISMQKEKYDIYHGHVRVCKNSKFCKIGSLFFDIKA
jgi:hypothetical protein